VRTATLLSHALIRAVATARRNRSTAVTVAAPRRAAAIANAPLPVQTSSTEDRPGSTSSASNAARSHVSEIGRKTPGSVTSRSGHSGIRKATPAPSARGPISERVIEALRRPPGSVDAGPLASCDQPLADDDLHLSLYVL
jgi:hypothetical protein